MDELFAFSHDELDLAQGHERIKILREYRRRFRWIMTHHAITIDPLVRLYPHLLYIRPCRDDMLYLNRTSIVHRDSIRVVRLELIDRHSHRRRLLTIRVRERDLSRSR